MDRASRFVCTDANAIAAEAPCSCCGYDDPMFAPEAFARRDLFRWAGGLAGAAAIGVPALQHQAQAQAPAPAPAPAPVREITQIAGNLYRFRNNFHFSVFAITPQGLEDQMLGIVVRAEVPELERQREKLILEDAANKAHLKTIEDEILALLAAAQVTLDWWCCVCVLQRLMPAG